MCTEIMSIKSTSKMLRETTGGGQSAGRWQESGLWTPLRWYFKPNPENRMELARARGRGKVFWVEGEVAWRAMWVRQGRPEVRREGWVEARPSRAFQVNKGFLLSSVGRHGGVWGKRLTVTWAALYALFCNYIPLQM